jgi:cystathionine gamma-synthase
MSYFELGPEELAAVGIDPSLIRLSVGIEETEDVLRDVLTALEKA